MNLNSRTHEQINQSDSRPNARLRQGFHLRQGYGGQDGGQAGGQAGGQDGGQASGVKGKGGRGDIQWSRERRLGRGYPCADLFQTWVHCSGLKIVYDYALEGRYG